jgi:hypothetical protein
MLTDPNYAVGLLGYGYAMLPYENTSVSDIATDDAVTNDKESNYSKMDSWGMGIKQQSYGAVASP